MIRSTLVRVLAGCALAGAFALVMVPLAPTPASAHNTLVSTVPDENAKVDQPPTEVELVYNAAVSDQFAQVVVSGSDGKPWQQGDPKVQGDTVTQPLKPLEDDTYTVSWRVVSADGHPIDGTYEFQVGAGGPASDGSVSDGESEAGTSDTPWLWPLIGLVGALVVVAAVLGGVVRARETARRRRSAD